MLFSRRQTTREKDTKTHFFAPRDLDLDPMTLTYELDLDILNTRTCIPKITF